MTELNFDTADTQILAGHLYDRKSDEVVVWLRAHILTHRDMAALLEFLTRAVHKIFPLGIMKGITPGDSEVWALHIGKNATEAQITAGQMMAAGFNADWDTVSAHVHAVMTKPDAFHAEVVVSLLSALGDGLRAAGAAHEGNGS